MISYGLQRSASTFAYQIIYDILESAGHDQQELFDRYAGSLISAPFVKLEDFSLTSFAKCVPPERIILLKTHSFLNEEAARLIGSGDVIATASYRNPMDAAVSLYNVGRKERRKPENKKRKGFLEIDTMFKAIETISALLPVCEGWIRHSAVLPI